MSFAAAATPVLTQVLNPLEASLIGFNTNPYFIGITMLLLNLGGRFLAMEVTKEQEKFFQHTWVRAVLIFVVVFVATRNVFVAFWLSLIVIIMLRFLFNENSSMFLLKREGNLLSETFQNPSGNSLTPEESDIYRKLTDKLAKTQPVTKETETEPFDIQQIYMTNMARIPSYL